MVPVYAFDAIACCCGLLYITPLAELNVVDEVVEEVGGNVDIGANGCYPF